MKENAPYLSSGTWSLLGVKTKDPVTTAESARTNWSNEGGIGYFRYQKNIMGLWLVNRLREELCPGLPFSGIETLARESRYAETLDANDKRFLAPESMKAAFDEALNAKPQTPGDYFACAYRSLALSYRAAVDELEKNTGKTFDRLVIVGGGAKNAYLTEETKKALNKTVAALPIEATALGNIKIQAEADA